MRTFLLAATLILPAIISPVAQQAPIEQKPVTESVPQQDDRPAPTAQGTRAPELTDTDTQNAALATRLRSVWESPVDLQGNPVSGSRPVP